MTTVGSTGAAAQQAIFDKLGINTQKTSEERASDDKLGQDDFLQLMTAQLQNQDPFAPMENGDFIAQMAQFSTVSGIEEINTNLKSLSSEMQQTRIATASTLLGHSVLVPGAIARPDDNGEIHGVFELPQAASATRVSFSDASSGELLHSEDLGGQGTGLVGFSWTDIPAALRETNRKIKVDVAANTGKGMENMGPSIYARVLSASSFGDTSSLPTLDVEDYGTRRGHRERFERFRALQRASEILNLVAPARVLGEALDAGHGDGAQHEADEAEDEAERANRSGALDLLRRVVVPRPGVQGDVLSLERGHLRLERRDLLHELGALVVGVRPALAREDQRVLADDGLRRVGFGGVRLELPRRVIVRQSDGVHGGPGLEQDGGGEGHEAEFGQH